MPKQGEVPTGRKSPSLNYHEGSLYLTGGEDLVTNHPFPSDFYRYDLTTQKWENLTSSSTYTHRHLHGSCVYEDYLYIFYGWSNKANENIDSLERVNLSDTSYKWETVAVNKQNDYSKLLRSTYGYSCVGDKFYMFGGYSFASLRNSLVAFDLSKYPLEYEILSDDYFGPLSRAEHSMVFINGYFYVFGGVNNQEILGDFWKYEESSDTWTEIEGELIGRRMGHACAAYSDIMVIWGGQNEVGLLSDAKVYNAFSGTWKSIEITSDLVPAPRKNHCAAMVKNKVYLYGGTTQSGLSSELWKLDLGKGKYELLSKNSLKGPGHLSGHSCYMDYLASRFYVMYGKTTSSMPLQHVHYFDLNTLTWHKVLDKMYSLERSRAKASIFKLDNKVFVAGGTVWDLEAANTFYSVDLESGEYTDYKGLEYVSFGGASLYYKNYFYIKGGGSISGYAIREYTPNNVFMKIDFNGTDQAVKCSPGSYQSTNQCIECPRGTFSDEFGLTSCKPCPEGSYNPYKGATTKYQCKPCPQGYYCPKKGSFNYLQCSGSNSCYPGSSKPNETIAQENYQTFQPGFLPDSNTKYQSLSSKIRVFFVSLGLSCLVLFLGVRKVRGIVQKFDFYKSFHNYTTGELMVFKKTFLGGYFSLVFVLVSVFILTESVIALYLNNTRETKTLVPYVVLEKQNSDITADFAINLKLYNYGASCVLDQQCHPSISFSYDFIVGDLKTTCEVFEAKGCSINFTCSNCRTVTGSKISLSVYELFAYTSAIQLNMTSTSSIPNESSLVLQTIVAQPQKVYIGNSPTQFFVNLIPSVCFT